MKVLLTGANGQLGRELQQRCPAAIELLASDRTELDITDASRVVSRLSETRPDVVISAAAYTAVDRAEEESQLAQAVNADGAGNVARAAAAVGARLIHISTDFVFDGASNRPYAPDSDPGPLSVYGASKLAGERQVMQATEGRAMVVRTAWVYSRFGNNFVKNMLRLMAERQRINVVVDQIGSPTWAGGLAELLWAACERPDLAGPFHWTDAGTASWYDFAIAVQEEATTVGMLDRDCAILPILSDAYPTLARRPHYSVLDTTATSEALGVEGTHWRRQLRTMLQELHEYGEN